MAPVASFTADVSSGVAPLNVNFSSTATGDITAYSWDIVEDSTGGSIGSSPDANTSFSFTTAGSYTVTLTVSGPGGTNSTSQTITVSAAAVAPVASFTADVSSGVAPLNVNFSSTATGDITAYSWDIVEDSTGGSIGSSPDANTSFSFTTAGSYTVTLTVSGPGGTNSASQTITVSAAAVAPVASFTADVSSGVAPLNVNFSSSATGDITAYSWNIVEDSTGGSIGSSPDANTSFSFTTAGSYTVTLTVSGPGGTDRAARPSPSAPRRWHPSPASRRMSAAGWRR